MFQTYTLHSKATPIGISAKRKREKVTYAHLSPPNSFSPSPKPYYFTKKKYLDDLHASNNETISRFQTYYPDLYTEIGDNVEIIDELMFLHSFPFSSSNFRTYIHNRVMVIIDKYRFDEQTTNLLFDFINSKFEI